MEAQAATRLRRHRLHRHAVAIPSLLPPSTASSTISSFCSCFLVFVFFHSSSSSFSSPSSSSSSSSSSPPTTASITSFWTTWSLKTPPTDKTSTFTEVSLVLQFKYLLESFSPHHLSPFFLFFAPSHSDPTVATDDESEANGGISLAEMLDDLVIGEDATGEAGSAMME